MPQLLTQSDVRPARNLPFCYLCGRSINSVAERHPDHIPPKAIFAESDRDFPLKVAAHQDCNNANAPIDRVVAQLIAVIHGKRPSEDDLGLETQVFMWDGSETPFLGLLRTDFAGQIARWIRGFHAALYHEFLPRDTPNAIHPPFPHGEMKEDGFTINKVVDQQYLFVEVIKKNRATQSLDGIICNNGKMKYECVWVCMDNGKSACVFALQIYKWADLADTAHFPKRGCVGWYQSAAGRPKSGTTGTDLEFTVSNAEMLDAFGT